MLDSEAKVAKEACKVVTLLFADDRFQDEFVKADGFLHLCKLMEKVTAQVPNSSVARQAMEAIGHLLVFSAKVYKLRLEVRVFV